MLRFQDGDRAAFAELVRRNTPKVHSLIYRFLSSAEHVDDLTQEVFLRIFRTAARYQPTAKFSTWLYRIAANLAFNVLRSRRRGTMRPLQMSGPDAESYTIDIPDERTDAPGRRMDTAELRQHLAQAIGELPDNQRIAIVLNKYEHKSYEEIAAILDCTTMAVKSLLSRARANLRKELLRYLRPD